jgi:hypothetical protein
MYATSISPGQLRAAISMLGLDRYDLAREADVCERTIRAWTKGGYKPGASGTIIANTRKLIRVIAALEARGIRFSETGLVLQRARGEPTATAAAAAMT